MPITTRERATRSTRSPTRWGAAISREGLTCCVSRCYGVAGTGWHDRRRKQPTERPMPQPNDLSRSPIALNQDGTLIAVIEMSRSSWLVAGIVPGIAPPAEEARARRGGAAGLARALAGRGDPGWARDHAHRRLLWGGPRRVLAGPLAPGTRNRGLCHPPDERGRLARTPAREDGPA